MQCVSAVGSESGLYSVIELCTLLNTLNSNYFHYVVNETDVLGVDTYIIMY